MAPAAAIVPVINTVPTASGGGPADQDPGTRSAARKRWSTVSQHAKHVNMATATLADAYKLVTERPDQLTVA